MYIKYIARVLQKKKILRAYTHTHTHIGTFSIIITCNFFLFSFNGHFRLCHYYFYLTIYPVHVLGIQLHEQVYICLRFTHLYNIVICLDCRLYLVLYYIYFM